MLGVLASVGVLSGCAVTADKQAVIAAELRAVGGVEAVEVTHRQGDVITSEYVGVDVRMQAGASAAQFRDAAEQMRQSVRRAQLVIPTVGTPTLASPVVSCTCILRGARGSRTVRLTLARSDGVDEAGLATLAHDLFADPAVQSASIDHQEGQPLPNATAHITVSDSATAGRVVAAYATATGLRRQFLGPNPPYGPNYVVADVPLTASTAGSVADLLDLAASVQPSRIPTVRIVSGLVDVTTAVDTAAGTATTVPNGPSVGGSVTSPPGAAPTGTVDPPGPCGVSSEAFASGPTGQQLRQVLARVEIGTVLQFRPGGCQVNVRAVAPGVYQPAAPDPAFGIDHTTAVLAVS